MQHARRKSGAALASGLMVVGLGLGVGAVPATAAPAVGSAGAVQLAGHSAPSAALIRVAGRSSDAFGPEERAEELYVDALEKLAAGHAGWARRTLADLLARFPDSKAAASARLRLGEIAGGRPGPKVIVAPDIEQAAPAIGHSPAWEQELRRNALIQARLRKDAGDRVFFGTGSADLGARARSAISAQAQWLKQWSEFEAAIEGHADDPGSETQNLKLSEARAESVRRRLVEEGVDPARLAVVAVGNSDRVATCSGPGCAAQNRRVVTLVFAAGTRERLGLAPIESAEASEPDRAPPEMPASPPLPQPPASAAKPVGLAR